MPSANEPGRKHSRAREGTFTVDGKFLRDEAREAIRSYFMPFAGLYAAAVGKEVRIVNASDLKPRKSGHKKGTRPSSHKSRSR